MIDVYTVPSSRKMSGIYVMPCGRKVVKGIGLVHYMKNPYNVLVQKIRSRSAARSHLSRLLSFNTEFDDEYQVTVVKPSGYTTIRSVTHHLLHRLPFQMQIESINRKHFMWILWHT